MTTHLMNMGQLYVSHGPHYGWRRNGWWSRLDTKIAAILVVVPQEYP